MTVGLARALLHGRKLAFASADQITAKKFLDDCAAFHKHHSYCASCRHKIMCPIGDKFGADVKEEVRLGAFAPEGRRKPVAQGITQKSIGFNFE